MASGEEKYPEGFDAVLPYAVDDSDGEAIPPQKVKDAQGSPLEGKALKYKGQIPEQKCKHVLTFLVVNVLFFFLLTTYGYHYFSISTALVFLVIANMHLCPLLRS